MSDSISLIRHCAVWYRKLPTNETYEFYDVTFAPAVAVRNHVIVCQLDGRNHSTGYPVSVGLSWGDGDNETTNFRVPIESIFSEQNNNVTVGRHRGNVGVCSSMMFGEGPDWRQLIEWIEMWRILGAGTVALYNHSVNEARVRRVLERYVTS